MDCSKTLDWWFWLEIEAVHSHLFLYVKFVCKLVWVTWFVVLWRMRVKSCCILIEGRRWPNRWSWGYKLILMDRNCRWRTLTIGCCGWGRYINYLWIDATISLWVDPRWAKASFTWIELNHRSIDLIYARCDERLFIDWNMYSIGNSKWLTD